MPAPRQPEEDAMSLADAIATLAAARGLPSSELADAIAGTQNRATFYRVLSGETVDPRLSTLVNVCEVLDVTPGELLRLAGMSADPAGPATVLDVALRHAVYGVQQLSEDDRGLVMHLVRAFVKERGPKAPARRQRSARAEPADELGDRTA
jgi:DNA-binding Xre family transcriptional regulator